MIRSRLVVLISAWLMLTCGASAAAGARVDGSPESSSRHGERLRPTIPENETYTGRLVNALPAEEAGAAGWHLQRPGRLIPLNVSEVSLRRVARFQGQRVRIDGYWIQPLGGDRVFVVTRIRRA
jgi:hypothetical protein